MLKQSTLIASLFQAGALAQTFLPADKSDPYFSKFADLALEKGVEWEPYEVETSDGWQLSLFRLTGRTGQYSKRFEEAEHSDKYPLYFAHGGDMDASNWLKSWSAELMDHGYDIWLGNYRGGTFGN